MPLLPSCPHSSHADLLKGPPLSSTHDTHSGLWPKPANTFTLVNSPQASPGTRVHVRLCLSDGRVITSLCVYTHVRTRLGSVPTCVHSLPCTLSSLGSWTPGKLQESPAGRGLPATPWGLHYRVTGVRTCQLVSQCLHVLVGMTSQSRKCLSRSLKRLPRAPHGDPGAGLIRRVSLAQDRSLFPCQ